MTDYTLHAEPIVLNSRVQDIGEGAHLDIANLKSHACPDHEDFVPPVFGVYRCPIDDHIWTFGPAPKE